MKRKARFVWWRRERWDPITLTISELNGWHYYFHLKAPNGKIICQSEAYNTKAACLKGIEAIKRYAADAEVVEK